jgi:hypothetical protein
MSSPSQQQQLQSISSTPSLTSLLHQKLTTNNDHQKVTQKQVLLNDIASGLANAVAVAVSNAVSNINNNSQQHQNNQEVLRQQLQQPPLPPPSILQTDPQKSQQFSHLRQQLESREPTTFHHLNNQNILRKRLSNINIEAAVASAVNRYLATTIKNNQEKIANSDDVDMIPV